MENVNNSIKKQSDMELSGIARLNLKDADVVQIWDEVSAYIEKNMSQSRGVNIPNFGTFSFVQKKLDIGGQNRYVLIQRPVFSIAEKFAQTHGLAFHKYPIAGVIPVHPLNYTAVAQETPFSRDQVELCVRHVLAVLNRSVAANRNVEFTFTGIGKLQIRHGKVKMKFFKEFVNECDMSGKAISDMQNRPHTADSVMSRNDSNRSQTRNTCVLPRINSRMGGIALNQLDSSININNNSGGAMDTITEENYESPRQVEVDPNQSYLAPVATLFSTDEANQSISHYIENQPNQQQEQQQQQTVKFHVPDAMPILRGASETLAQETSAANLSFASPPSSIVYLSPNEAETVNSIMKQSAAPEHHTHQQQQNSYSPIEVSVSASVPNLARPSSKTLLGSLIAPSSASSTSGGHHHHHAVACSHQNAGQELCYLCHQRQRRNVPVYLHEETKRREKEESQLLAQYQHLKDMDKQLRDEEKRNAQRVDRAKMDAFNLGMSEAIRSKKHERPKTCDVSRSFIFRKRCKTPPKFIKQQDLRDYLSKQIESKQRETNMTKEEIKFVEKFEQLQLAEELAAQRESYLKEKFQRQRDLKAALDVQVKHKPEELPRALPDSEVFGEWDAKNEKLAQAKMREVEAFKYNKEKIEQRKREELLGNLREQDIDSENVERMKEELKIDRANRFRRMVDMRQGLETNWSFAVREKKHRDLDDREHRMAHDGLLVHEQCDRYRRCAQCQRDLKNCGETNIWRDSRYAAGNRIIV